jgi:hypothetical protein
VLSAWWSIRQEWLLNVGLVKINRGLMTGCEVMVERGQQVLSILGEDNPYRSLAEAKLDSSNLLVNGGFEFLGYGWMLDGPSEEPIELTQVSSHCSFISLAAGTSIMSTKK